ncbi:MAG: hypothetical protein V7637_4376 [Mycobacteriales bacterium]
MRTHEPPGQAAGARGAEPAGNLPGTPPRLAALRQAVTGGAATWAALAPDVDALQRTIGNGAVADLVAPPAARPSTVDSVVNGPGHPLDPGIRADLESRWAADLSAVRVHTDSAAHSSATSLNALAYTAGSHVVFQHGHYDPSSAAGRHLLTHELVHVLQQRDGRVAGAAPGPGIAVSDPRDRFEREADAVAAGTLRAPALRQRPARDPGGARDPGEPAARPVSAGPATRGAPVVQRKVGFEFETGWYVQQEGLFRRRWLKKKEPVGTSTFDGFKVEADEAGDASEIEFIVHPPVEEGLAGWQRLDAVMTDMTTFGDNLEDAGRFAQGQPFPLSLVTGAAADKSYVITPTADLVVRGGPQVTSGIDLAKIGQLANLYHDASAPPDELKGTLSILATSAGKASAGAAALGVQISPRLQGLIAVLVTYLEAGADRYRGEEVDAIGRYNLAAVYPKAIANTLLARTDFAGLFALLPLSEEVYYATHPRDFIRVVLASTDPALGIKEDDPLFARGVRVHEENPDKGIYAPSLTVGDWLYAIPHGFDSLTGIKDALSLGEFGPRTEKVGPHQPRKPRVDAGIFEFRGAQETKLPLSEWKPFALKFQRFISEAHYQ